MDHLGVSGFPLRLCSERVTVYFIFGIYQNFNGIAVSQLGIYNTPLAAGLTKIQSSLAAATEGVGPKRFRLFFFLPV